LRRAAVEEKKGGKDESGAQSIAVRKLDAGTLLGRNYRPNVV